MEFSTISISTGQVMWSNDNQSHMENEKCFKQTVSYCWSGLGGNKFCSKWLENKKALNLAFWRVKLFKWIK